LNYTKLRQKNIMQVPLGPKCRADLFRPERACEGVRGKARPWPRGSPADYQVAFFECNLVLEMELRLHREAGAMSVAATAVALAARVDMPTGVLKLPHLKYSTPALNIPMSFSPGTLRQTCGARRSAWAILPNILPSGLSRPSIASALPLGL